MAAEAVVLALLNAAGAAVVVQSASDCPTAAQIQERLAPLRAADAPDRAVVTRTGESLRLVLVRPDGSAVVERQLEARGTCAELAQALAVVIAAWHAQLHAALPPAPSVAPPPTVGPALVLETVPRATVSLADAQVAPGALVGATVWRGRWGVGATVAGSTRREQSLGSGTAAWTRIAVGLGAARRLLAGAINLDARLEALAGLALASGSGYAVDRSQGAWAPGVGGALDLTRALGALVLSLGVGGAAWPVAQEMAVGPAALQRRPLPQLDARVAAGLGLRFDL